VTDSLVDKNVAQDFQIGITWRCFESLTGWRPTMDTARTVTEKPKRGKSLTKQVGARIALLRERAGLNQVETAKGAGLSQSHLCNMENGVRSIDIEKLQAIAKTIGCKVVDLLPRSEGGTPIYQPLQRIDEDVDD
jgi:DNA-binding XRE family transcriptional regulator